MCTSKTIINKKNKRNKYIIDDILKPSDICFGATDKSKESARITSNSDPVIQKKIELLLYFYF